MLSFGIESTCDETSCAIVRDGHDILSQVIASQVDLHSQFGGVVPELASRLHVEMIFPLAKQALLQAQKKLSDIDIFCCARGPGLIGALLVGLHFAKGLAWATGKPLVGVNHIEAHLFASMMSKPIKECAFPALGLVLSGGHTSLVLIHSLGHYTLLGQTVDDAIGESFDKVAKMLSLPYPGGPNVEKYADGISPKPLFKVGSVKGRPLDFSFAGLKTQVLYRLRGKNLERRDPVSDDEKKEIASSFQHAAFMQIIQKIKLALSELKEMPKAIFFGGGVAQNKALFKMCQESLNLPLIFPPADLCSDNGAMIAGLGFYKYVEKGENELFTLEPETRIPF